MKYRICSWDKYQHYKDRNPKWIKLHTELLSSRMWVMLDDASRVLAIACMVLAAREHGCFDADPEFVKRVAFLNSTPDFSQLIKYGFLELLNEDGTVASDPLASCYQSASLEKRREEKRRSEKRRKEYVERLSTPDVDLVVEHYQKFHPQAHPDLKVRAKIKARLNDGYTAEQLCKAIDGCHLSPWHCGMNDNGRKYQGLELIIRDSTKVDQFIALSNPKTAALQTLSEKDREWAKLAMNQEASNERAGQSAPITAGDQQALVSLRGQGGPVQDADLPRPTIVSQGYSKIVY